MRYQLAFCGLILTGLATGQIPSEPPETVIRSSVREVLLDVVVRNRDLSLDRKLKVTDFTVTEDGVPQSIRSFRLVGGREAQLSADLPRVTGPATKVSKAQTNSLSQPNFVSIVFGELGPDRRTNGIEAADEFLNQQLQKNTYAAIFRVDNRLNAISGFTNDRADLERAVRSAVSGNSMDLARLSTGVLNQSTYATTGGPAGVSVGPTVDPTRSPDLATSAASDSPLAEGSQAMAKMLSDERYMVSAGAGTRNMLGLLRMVQYESELPGRKTILYLSEGLTLPPDRPELMSALVSAANRGNVTFYCVDIRGLNNGTSNGAVTSLVQATAALSATQSTAPSSPAAGRQQMHQWDMLQEALSAHTQLAMAELAEGTGGFAVFNTNGYRKSMVRMMEDIRTHYEISYVPTATVYDGHFRQIKVSVNNPKLLVQSRNGYFAVPELKGTMVLPYELAGLRALDDKLHPRAFEFKVAAMRFRPAANGFGYEIAFDVPTANLTTHVDAQTHRARIHATFVALLKDPAGQITAKVSNEVDREVPGEKLDEFRRGEIIFTSPVQVPAGRYTLEAAVIDTEGDRASTKRAVLIVAQPGPMAMSNIVVVRTLEQLAEPRDPGDPLQFSGGKVIPSLNQSAKDAAETSLYFVIYPRAASEGAPLEKPKVTVQLLRDGLEVVRTEPEVQGIDEVNSIPVIASAKLPVGEYQARVTVQQAGLATQQTIALNVVQ